MYATRLFRGVLIVSAVGIVVAGCGGGSSSSSTGASGSMTLKRLDVEVERGSAQAPARSLLAQVGALLGWPQVAEASHCQVTAGTNNVTGFTNAEERASLPGVSADAAGNVSVTITCSDGGGGSFTLTGAQPNSVVTVRVRVEPGRVEVRVKDVKVSPSPSPSQKVSPSQKRSG